MPYNNIISRTDAAALIPEEVSRQILQEVPKQSLALQLFQNVPMARNQYKQPVLAALATAYWVAPTDTGLKQTTELNWANVYLNAEEIACIVPIPETVLDDASFDIWGQVRPQLAAAIGRTLDAAVFFSTNKPASWPEGLGPAAVAAGNFFQQVATQAQGGVASDLINTYNMVWADGYTVNFGVAPPALQASSLNARDTMGRTLDDFTYQDGQASLGGVPLYYGLSGLWPVGANAINAIVGDRSKVVIGVRQDITYKILDQAVIQDGSGAIQFNLAQQDMVALRVVARYAYAVPNPVTIENPTPSTRFPIAAMKSAT